ncbi:MAG TPA: Bax inhibitor-1/YccA family protein [Flavisolibacter sp.]|nr:Bax inhibitor-1/YccA family protein [Flavisolibacter sp.]
MNNDIFLSPEQVALEQQRFIVKVYGYMAGALGITGLVAMFTASSAAMLNFIFGTPGVLIGLVIAELLLVISLGGFIRRLSAFAATAIFIAYSILNGLTLSAILLVYTSESVASTFFITAGLFGLMSAYGYYTRTDLTKLGNILLMALIGVILASIVNIFMHSQAMYWIITYAGVFIFTGLIAYDTQKIKSMSVLGQVGAEEERKGAIIGALSLYLDFINLFLMLLRFFGRRR